RGGEREPAKPIATHFRFDDTPSAPARKTYSIADTPVAPELKGGAATPSPTATPAAVETAPTVAEEVPIDEPNLPEKPMHRQKVVVLGDRPPPTPVYTPDPRPKEGAKAGVIAWRVRPYRIP